MRQGETDFYPKEASPGCHVYLGPVVLDWRLTSDERVPNIGAETVGVHYGVPRMWGFLLRKTRVEKNFEDIVNLVYHQFLHVNPRVKGPKLQFNELKSFGAKGIHILFLPSLWLEYPKLFVICSTVYILTVYD